MSYLQAFLSLCQGNHYQFDTVRRARHSSMMVLYHLHNPTEPAFASTCNNCSREIEMGEGFRCTVCSDFDLCKDCQAAGVHSHHTFTVRTVPLARHEVATAVLASTWIWMLVCGCWCKIGTWGWVFPSPSKFPLSPIGHAGSFSIAGNVAGSSWPCLDSRISDFSYYFDVQFPM